MTDRATLRDQAPDIRAGLPPDLQDLRYPREIWPGHANLGAARALSGDSALLRASDAYEALGVGE